MAKSRKRKAGAGKNARPHRRNPVTRRTRRHHRNPSDILNMETLKQALAGTLGLGASVYVPSLLLGALGMPDSGVPSYLAAAAVTIGPALLLSKMQSLAKGWFIGGAAGIGWRIIDDTTGSQAITIQRGGMSSFFTKPLTFPLPAQSVFGAYAAGGRPALPPAMPTGGAAPVAGKHGMSWVQM